jgi:type I restriction enzyme S subunit
MIMKPPTTDILPQGYKMTELGPLPEEWEVVKLGEVAEKMKAGGTPRRSVKEYWGGNIPFVLIEDMTSCNLYLSKTKETITEEGINNSNAWLVPPNTILLSMYATIGETAINTIPVTTNQAILAIIPKDNFDAVFGAYILKYNDQRLIMQNIQSTQKNINKGIVDNFKIPLPPLSEQQKIAAVLSAVQEAKEKTQAVIDATKVLKKSMMKHLFTYGPVPPEETENVPLKETEIGKVPEDWKVVKLGEVTNVVMGQSPPGTSYNESGEGFPFLQGKAEFGSLHPKHIKYTTIPMKLAPKNSILLSVRAPVGDTNIADIEYCIGRGLSSISLKEGDNIFLFYILSHLKGELEKEGTGSIFKAITKTKLMNFSLPLPFLPTQQKIATILSAIDAKIEAEENKKQALEDLFKTLLHNLMTAKIRVTAINELP